MRLTLRTLLAYMDDRLKPAQAKEIGDKIQQSEFASELVNRIGSVIRQRRLASPAATGNAAPVDPNLLAEYLDDQLAPDIVEAIERRILTSDVCLAEVAASHQVLADIREPLPVGHAFRDRLYAVGESVAVTPSPKNGQPAKPVSEPAAPSAAAGKSDETEKHAARTATTPSVAGSAAQGPDSADSTGLWTAPAANSSWKRWLPAAIVIAAGLAWIGIVINDNPFGDSSGESLSPANDSVAEAADEQADKGDDADGTSVAGPDAATVAGIGDTVADVKTAAGTGESGVSTDADSQTGLPATAAAVAQDEQIPPTVPDTSATVAATDAAGAGEAPTPGVEVNAGGANAVVPKTDDDEAAAKPATEVIPGAPLPVKVTLLSGDGIMLVRRDGSDWQLSLEFGADLQPPDGNQVARALTLDATDTLGVPDPFSLTVTIGESGWQGMVLSDSLVGILPAEGDLPGGLKLRQGRIRFAGDPTAVRDEDSTVMLRIGAVDHSWLVQPATEDTVFGFEVRRPLSAGVGESPPTEGGLVAVYVASGQIKILDAHADAADEPLVLVQGQSRAIGTGSPAVAAIPVSTTHAIEVLPDWIYSDAVLPDPESAPAKQFKRILENDRTLVMGLLSNISDRNPQVARYCGESIALMEDPVLLVECLLESNHEEVRRAAIRSVRAWLADDATRSERLNDLLLKRLPSAEVPSIVRLLQGFPRSAASSSDISAELLSAMEASRLLVREIAFYYVEGMTGQRHGYSADDDSLSRRRRAMQQWKRHIDQLGGRLAPALTPDAPAPENAAPDDAAPDSTTPDGAAPDDAAPDGEAEAAPDNGTVKTPQ